MCEPDISRLTTQISGVLRLIEVSDHGLIDTQCYDGHHANSYLGVKPHSNIK